VLHAFVTTHVDETDARVGRAHRRLHFV